MNASLSRWPEDPPPPAAAGAGLFDGPRVLLLQSDPACRALTQDALRGTGWQPQWLDHWRRGASAADRLPWLPPHDLLILDPRGLDGQSPGALDWTPLREHVAMAPGTPVIVLLASDGASDKASDGAGDGPRDSATNRVLALEMGADAVIDWPCHPRELVLRTGAALRLALARPRRGGSGGAVRPLGQAGGAWLDLATRRLHGGATPGVQLSLAEVRLLCAFLERPGRVLGRDDLLARSRGEGVEQLDRSIDLLVSRLRRKLAAGSDGAARIRTVRGAGYCFET